MKNGTFARSRDVAVFLLLIVAGAAASSFFPVGRGAGPKPKANQAEFKEWQDMHFGMFIHWGPVSLKGTEISWSRGGGRRGIEGKGEIPVEVYDNLYRQFDPVKFNAAEWVALARTAGMKYMILTAKHCDGFCLWPSRVDDYNVGQTPFKRDICGELAAAAHKARMRIGWYYSPMDWRDPDCRTERNAAYVARMQGHLRELLGNYGRIDRLWFDTDGGPAPWDQEKTYALVRSLQPQIIINNRLDMGSMDDYKTQRIGPWADYATPEQRVGEFDIEKPWETCMTLGTQWSWKPNDTIKSTDECVRILVRCATGGGNLLLNIGPMPSGEIEPRQVEVLKGIGAWLDKYGETIYGTRGGPVRNGAWGGMTHKGDIAYVHVLKWDGDTAKLPAMKAKIVSSKVLTGGEAMIEQTADGLVIRMPAVKQDRLDTIVKLGLEGPDAAK
jgi:alpha-L-fucosidase